MSTRPQLNVRLDHEMVAILPKLQEEACRRTGLQVSISEVARLAFLALSEKYFGSEKPLESKGSRESRKKSLPKS